jgi:hypothetical protein
MNKELEELAQDPVLSEISWLMDASKRNVNNNRFATLRGIEEVQRNSRETGEELLRDVYHLDEEYDFVPEGGFKFTNVKNNTERFEENGVVQPNSYLLNQRGMQLLDFTDEVEGVLKSPMNFQQASSEALSDLSKGVSKRMGQNGSHDEVEEYLSQFVDFTPVEDNPLVDGNYTTQVGNILNALAGDKLIGFMALADENDISYGEVAEELGYSASTIGEWVREQYRDERLMHDDSRDLTPVGSEVESSITSFYNEVK